MEVSDPQWVCEDCLVFIANGDLTGLDYHYNAEESTARQAAIIAGYEREAPGSWVAGGTCDEHERDHESCERAGCDTIEFSRSSCDCCRMSLAGARHKASILYPKGAP